MISLSNKIVLNGYVYVAVYVAVDRKKNHAMESEARHQSRESGKNQLRRGKPRVRIACVMMMLMMCCRVAAAGVVVDDEETEELGPWQAAR